MTEQAPSDPMVSRLRRAALGGADWLNDVADRLLALQMPHADVIRLAEVLDDGVHTDALVKALCRRVEAQRRQLAKLHEENAQLRKGIVDAMVERR